MLPGCRTRSVREGLPGSHTPTVRLTERARTALHGPQETPERGQVSASSRRKEKGLPANPAGDTGANRVISGKAGSRTGGPQGQSGPDRVTDGVFSGTRDAPSHLSPELRGQTDVSPLRAETSARPLSGRSEGRWPEAHAQASRLSRHSGTLRRVTEERSSFSITEQPPG